MLWTMPHPEAALRAWRDVTVAGGAVIAIDGTWWGGTTLGRGGAVVGRDVATPDGRAA